MDQPPRPPREGAPPAAAPSRALGDPDKMAGEIERHLRARIAGGSVPLPPMPRAVVQCLQLLHIRVQDWYFRRRQQVGVRGE